MNSKQLADVSRGLMWVAEQMADLPEEREQATRSMMVCSLAALIVNELAYHLDQGSEPYDAVLRTARGEYQLTDEQQILWKILSQPGHPGNEPAS